MNKVKDTAILAKEIRLDILRMVNLGSSAHVGSAFSCTDILACLYNTFLKIDPANPEDPERDIFILSKGHAGAAVYATLANFGFFSKEILDNHYKDNSDLSGNVSHKNIPGVEFSTGSLGHGLPVAVGVALGMKKKSSNRKVCVLLSDGECDEGSVWEGAMFAAHHELTNLLCVIDYNKIQSLDTVENTLKLEPFAAKWTAFGWNVIEVNGHDHGELIQVLQSIRTAKRPTCLIAHTTKGKGVSFMENSVLWHYRTPVDEEFKNAIQELESE